MVRTTPILLRDTRAIRDLGTEADDLLMVAIATRAGRAAKALTSPDQLPLQQTLVALCAGHRIPDHEEQGEATLQVLRGAVRVTGCEVDELLSSGELTALPPGRAAVEAIESAVVLLTAVVDAELPWGRFGAVSA